MNIFEAASSKKPFSNPSIIGAYMLVENTLVHRDNECDFKAWTERGNDFLGSMEASDLTRTDWFTINL